LTHAPPILHLYPSRFRSPILIATKHQQQTRNVTGSCWLAGTGRSGDGCTLVQGARWCQRGRVSVLWRNVALPTAVYRGATSTPLRYREEEHRYRGGIRDGERCYWATRWLEAVWCSIRVRISDETRSTTCCLTTRRFEAVWCRMYQDAWCISLSIDERCALPPAVERLGGSRL
jgi:hypothetical protein